MRPARCPTAVLAAILLAPVGCSDPPRGQAPDQVARHGPGGEAECLAFSPDGKYLAVGTAWRTGGEKGHWKGSVTVYDVAADKEVATLNQPRWVHALAFSPDGKYLAVGCGVKKVDQESPTSPPYQETPGELAVYATADFKEAFRYVAKDSPSEVRGAAFHPTGGSLYAVITPGKYGEFKPGELRSWSVPGFKEGWVTTKPQTQYIGLAACGDKLLATDHGSPVRVFAADTGRHRADVLGGDQVIASADGRLAAALALHRCGLIDVDREVPTDTPRFSDPDGNGVRADVAALSADGGRIALSGRAYGNEHRYHVGVWDLKTGAKVYWEADKVRYAALAFSPDGKLLAGCGPASGSGKGHLTIWKVPALK